MMRRCSDDDDARDSLSMSLCSATSSSSLTLSPPNSPKIVITSSVKNNEDVGDTYGKLTRVKTNSREKLILVPHADGLLNEPKRPLEEVNFCFHCGKEDLMRSSSTRRRQNTVEMTQRDVLPQTSTTTTTTTTWDQNAKPAKRRPRSTSSIGVVGREQLRSSVEKTGAKLIDGLFVTIYREVRLCVACHDETVTAKSNNSAYILKITSDARAYF